MIGWLVAVALAVLLAVLNGLPWWAYVITVLVTTIVYLLLRISDAFRWPGW